jgi:hypothetical protein
MRGVFDGHTDSTVSAAIENEMTNRRVPDDDFPRKPEPGAVTGVQPKLLVREVDGRYQSGLLTSNCGNAMTPPAATANVNARRRASNASPAVETFESMSVPLKVLTALADGADALRAPPLKHRGINYWLTRFAKVEMASAIAFGCSGAMA